MLSLINEGKYPHIQVTQSVSSPSNLQPIYYDSNTKISIATLENSYMYSEKPIYTFWCQVKMTIRENLINIVFAFSVVFGIYSQLQKFIRNRRYNNLAQSLYSDILKELKDLNGNLSGTITGLSEKDILRRYMSMDSASDGLARDESTFNGLIWPLLKQIRKKDKKTDVFQKQQYG